MNSKTIAMLVGAVLLGMLLANMLKNDGGCKLVEGLSSCNTGSVGPLDSDWTAGSRGAQSDNQPTNGPDTATHCIQQREEKNTYAEWYHECVNKVGKSNVEQYGEYFSEVNTSPIFTLLDGSGQTRQTPHGPVTTQYIWKCNHI